MADAMLVDYYDNDYDYEGDGILFPDVSENPLINGSFKIL